MIKRAIDLERGDVITVWGRRAVVTEPSDSVGSMPQDQTLSEYGVTARHCCEPRVTFLSQTGRLTHKNTYFIAPKRWNFEVREFLDLEIRGAIPKSRSSTRP